MIKRLSLWLVILAAGLQSVGAFTPAGPVGNGGDAYQKIEIGYGPPRDFYGPKNLGEEYRPNAPLYYFAYDANFLNYFGSNGVVAVDGAFGILNQVFTNNPTGKTNGLDGYSRELSEFPLEATSFNYSAQALGLSDLKSTALGVMVEELGLAIPERYVWTLHDRLHVGTIACPVGMEYLVIQRNFDVVDSPLNHIQYSSYINNTLYTYFIQEFCTGNPTAFTVPFTQDTLANDLTTVASSRLFGFDSGSFYTGLTRDDVGGLRYLLTTNNINIENTAFGSLLQITNAQPPSLLTTLPISLLLSSSVFSDPNTLQTNYPGLTILGTTTNIIVQVTNIVVPYFTNQSELPVFSNTVVGGLPNVTTLTNLFYFTNQPGPTVINYDRGVPFTTISTLDLATFVDAAKTNDPVTLQALYPALQILRFTTSPAFIGVTNYLSYLTNLTGSPYPGVPKLVTVAISTNYLWVTNWTYTFGNVFTNHYYTNRFITVQSIWITNQIGAPFGSPFVARTNLTTYKTNLVSGDFFLIPTNWCGFDLTLAFPLGNPPFKTGLTNVVIFPGFNTNGAPTGTNNLIGGNSFGLLQSYYDIYTNYNYAVYPGICEPVLAFGTNYSTNIVTVYGYNFGNVVTNSYYTNSRVTVVTTNVSLLVGGTPGELVTNVTTTVTSNGISGDFFIVPPTWCGYKILSTLLTNVVFTTNTVVATNSSGATNLGQYYSQTTITSDTNHTFLIQISTCQGVTAPARLRQGIEKISFVRANFDSLLGQFFQPITNTYTMKAVTNSQLEVEYYQRVAFRPDFLFTADDMTDVSGNPTLFVGGISRTISFDQGNVLPNLAGPGVINRPTTIGFEKVGDVFENGFLLLSTNSTILSEYTQSPLSLVAWGSFDSSTNDPVVYPNGTSIQNLINQVLIQITPTTLPLGTHGVVYPATTFTAAGGAFSAPYTWSLAFGSAGLPPGLALSASGTISGTPTQPGTFDFIIQLTDSLSRNVQWNYSITIQ